MRRIAPCLLLLPALAVASQTEYRIDPANSQATFRVRLLWLDSVNGHFNQVDGDVKSGPHPDSWVVDATIAVNSIAMSSSRMRQWVMTPAFFDAEHHPVIHFVSDPIAHGELDHSGTLSGYLTLRGVTAPVHFAMWPVHCERLALEPCQIVLHGHVHRSVFGMVSDRLALSDNVDLNLRITLQREIR
ncbi:YceI family protein [Dyella jejuensis]|uniref:YceI family protein n=1 Tax=Dyella jejuensis TaxID=1432009 RepID=A0ABW8JH89_9GAMM